MTGPVVVWFLLGFLLGCVFMFGVAVYLGRRSRTLRQQIACEMQQAYELGQAERKARRGGGKRGD